MLDSVKYQEAVHPELQGWAKHINSITDASLIIHRRDYASPKLFLIEKTLCIVVSCMDTVGRNEFVLAEIKKKKRDFLISLLIKLHSAYLMNGSWLMLS